MSQQNDVKRQAIKQAEQEQQVNILSGILNNETKTYTFEKTLSVGGQQKSGSFTAKYMGVGARLKLGSLRAKLLDGAPTQSLDVLTDDIAYMIAYLTVALTDTPSWFNYDDLDNISDLRGLYMEVYNFVNSFRGQNAKNSDVGDSSTASGQETVGNMQAI